MRLLVLFQKSCICLAFVAMNATLPSSGVPNGANPPSAPSPVSGLSGSIHPSSSRWLLLDGLLGRSLINDHRQQYVHASESQQKVGGKSSGQEGRFFGLFSPFNPLNPFAGLIATATGTTGSNTLLQQLGKKGPLIATATLRLNNAGNPSPGAIHFLQVNSLKPMVVVGVVDYDANVNSVTIDIRQNPAGTAGADDCTEGTMGSIYNPNSVASGGQLGNTAVTNAGLDLFSVFINDVPVNRATLFNPNSIIGRGIRIIDAADPNTATKFICGTITVVA